ncbi:MAG: diaminopropionate ammonia-lyase [Myxococcaceae bacterium]|nr:diaminopropionate ammonia-lyase [Myxococcaceae bacterium]
MHLFLEKPPRPGPAPTQEPLAFHRTLLGYQPTPLRHAPLTAHALGLQDLWLKDEGDRLGLPAFKILGASWAVHRLLQQRFGVSVTGDPASLAQLENTRPLTLVTASYGNHGRAVARAARWFGQRAHVYLPFGTRAARIAAIESEGASVTVVDGGYDDAVKAASAATGKDVVVVSDIAQRPDEEIPRWVTEGYSTCLWELQSQLSVLPRPPTLVTVPVGVGALAAAVVRHFRGASPWPQMRLVSVEPDDAASLLESASAGQLTSLGTGPRSIMGGLNCETPSSVVFDELLAGLDGFVTVSDDDARTAMRLLHRDGIRAGESGAAGVAGILALSRLHPAPTWLRETLRTVVSFVTEGPTDPESYRAIVGTP